MILRRLLLLLMPCVLSLPLVAAETSSGDAKGAPIDVLMISGNEDRGQIGAASLGQPGWHKFKDACAAQGVRVHILGEGGSTYAQLTPELLRKFQVILCAGAPHNYNIAQTKVAEGDAFVQRLDDYHKAGGGIIFDPFGHDNDPKFWTDSFGKRYDAVALEEEIYDPPHVLHVNPLYKSIRCDYFWTGAIVPHPVTDGMKGLLLPRHGDYDYTGTVPMQFGKSWTVLVRGAETARTIGLADSGGASEAVGADEGAYSSQSKGTYTASPEIIGVREFDSSAGRMMVFPFHPAHTWSNFHSWVLNDAMMLNGYDTYRSDGMKMFLNACRWLAEPATKAGLGGYVPPPEKTMAEVTPVDWSKAEFPANSWSGTCSWFNARTQEDVVMSDIVTSQSRDFKGILGARTAYSDGSGTVAEYVAEAKKLGLSFVVFLEDLQKIDADKYAKLVADCKASSSADFRALPGYLFRDTIDVQYDVIDAAQLPPAVNLTSDRRVKAPSDIFIPGNNYVSGGIFGLGQSKMDPYFLLSYFTIAPYVYDNGKLVDDGFSMYKSLQGRLHHQTPVSVTIVRSPADLATTVANAHLVVYHANDMSVLAGRLGPQKLWPNPVYITSGPSITRWGAINPIGLPFAPGRQRVRFALEAHSDAGLADVTILDARTGNIVRHFKPGAKDFACMIDETHKDQWYLIPIITDTKGRTALGPTLETFQDGGRISAYMDNVDSGAQVIGWDENHKKLNQWSAWIAPPFHKGSYPTGDMPANPFADELIYHGVDGSSIGCGHCEIDPQVVMGNVTEPKISAFFFENWLASFDNLVGKFGTNGQFLADPMQKLPGTGWTSAAAIPQPMQNVDISTRVESVRARYHAPFSANINEVDVTFKKDCPLTRINILHTFNRVQTGPMYVTGKDSYGEWSELDDGAKDSIPRTGEMAAGDYILIGSDYSGAPAVINVGTPPISYDYSGQHLDVYIDGKNRAMKSGDKITARFMILNKPREGQNNSAWIKKFIADYAVGGGTPAYSYTLSQGKLRDVNYTLNLDPENGGSTVAVKKFDLPHNLLVKVSGMPANAIAGRYDADKKQLLILPVYENTATTSINTTLGDARLYIGELFHCDDDKIILSCVQDGADKLLLEVHNPTDSAKTVKVAAVPGFTPLAGLDKTLTIPPCSSTKLALPASAGSLVDSAYQGD